MCGPQEVSAATSWIKREPQFGFLNSLGKSYISVIL